MPRPRTISDEDIDRAAREVFLARGPAASVALVAARLGVSQPAVLKRVGSKEALLVRALRPTRPPYWLERLAGDPPGPQALRPALVDILCDACAFFTDLAPRLVVLRASGLALEQVFPADAPPMPRLARGALAAWLARAVELSASRAAAVAEVLIGAIEARGFLRDVGGPGWVSDDDRAFVEAAVDAVLRLDP